MSNATCPLCDGPAKVQPSERIDGDAVSCKRCGNYKIEYHALTGFEDKRHLIAGLTRRATMPEKPALQLKLTHDNIPELLATS